MTFFKSIKSKAMISMAIFALVFLSILISTLLVSSGKKSDSLVINIAGRQRMLNQKIMKESLAYLYMPQSQIIKKESLKKIISLFNMSINALIDGGETFIDIEMTKKTILPSTNDSEILKRLKDVKLLWSNFSKKLTSMIETRTPNQQEIEKIMVSNSEILKDMDQTVSLMQQAAENKVSILIAIQVIGLVFFIITGFLFMSMISRNLVKPISSLVETFEKVASGDLSIRASIQGDDEISYLSKCFDKVVDNLSEIIRKVKNSSDEVIRSTSEIASGSDELSIRTNEEAASVTQTSATLEELTSIVKENRNNAEEIGTSLAEFNKEIHSKTDLMTNVTDTMTEIHESGRKIDAIVNVINDISFQTNLLALNAAVEAARAGEAGRGFAVVAAEVRNLAQKTAESSKTIQEIVSKNVESTERGLDLVKQTNNFFSTILQVMQDIVNRIEQIEDGSKQQATGVEQINISVSQLEKVINQNASLVEELSSTTKNMKSNTGELQELVAHFILTENSKKTEKPTTTKTDKSAPKTDFPKKATSKPAPTPTSPSQSKSKKDEKEKIEETPKKPSAQKESAEDFFASDEDGFEEF